MRKKRIKLVEVGGCAWVALVGQARVDIVEEMVILWPNRGGGGGCLGMPSGNGMVTSCVYG